MEEKKKLPKWHELPYDIQEYFILRIGGLALLLVVFIILCVAMKSSALAMVLFLSYIIMCGLLGYNYFSYASGKIEVFEGVFERFDSTYKDKPNQIIGTYGTASVTIKLNDGSFVRAGVSGNFKASEDSVIRIYTKPDTLIEENDNTRYTSYPMLVKVCKNQ